MPDLENDDLRMRDALPPEAPLAMPTQVLEPPARARLFVRLHWALRKALRKLSIAADQWLPQ